MSKNNKYVEAFLNIIIYALYMLVFFLLPIVSNAKKQGRSLLDSLYKQIATAKEDSNKVKLLNDISIENYTINPDEGIKYGNDELFLAEKLVWEKGKAMAYNALGLNYEANKNHEKALDYYFNALKINEKIGYKYGIEFNLGNIGQVYNNECEYPKAIEYYFKALKICEESGFKIGIARNLGNIALVYQAIQDYPKTLAYNHKALKILKEKDDKIGVARTLGNIANVYNTEAKYDSALAYYEDANKIYFSLNDSNGITVNLGNMGQVFQNQKNYSKALENYFIALKQSEIINNKFYQYNNLGNIGEAYYLIAKDTSGLIIPSKKISESKEDNLQKAISYLKKGLEGCKSINDLDGTLEFSKYEADAYKLAGNFSEALFYYKQYTLIKDSVYSIERIKEITLLETKRELELKDKQIGIDKIDLAKKRTEDLFSLAGLVVLLLIIGLMVRSYNNQKKSNQLLVDLIKKHPELNFDIDKDKI